MSAEGDKPTAPTAEAGPSAETAVPTPAPASTATEPEAERKEEKKAEPMEEMEEPVGKKHESFEKNILQEQAAPAALTSTTGPVWPELAADHPLAKFFSEHEELTKQAEHSEVYGIKLAKDNEFHTKLILQKFLRANSDDLTKAKEQLLETLKWRKEFDPVKATTEAFPKEKFGGLGYILTVDGVKGSENAKDIVTFNIYGAVKDNEKTFGDLDGFLRWRVGIMEKSVEKLGLANATKPIPDFGKGPDPYQGIQIHDYLQVSFLRMNPHAKAASKKTIDLFQHYYPETLSRKFFVNVPVIMGWLFSAMRLLVAKETLAKLQVLSYGNQLANELGKGLPKSYGGEAEELDKIGEGMKVE